MNEKNGEQRGTGEPDWNAKLLPLISALAGIVVLWATWFFYNNALDDPGFPWYRWIQPVLMVLGGVMCLIAAPLLLMRRDSGRDLLRMAVVIIPAILAIRLLIVGILFLVKLVSKLSDGTVNDWLSGISDLNPVKIGINIAVVAVVILFVLWGKAASKAKQTTKEK
ncbi:hypothetical protein ACFOLF_35050 [Paenibacillus sepulcri]|uniref:Uncharacterized protein n=1 Tax=Paenibacillus sepulcri TaxID=359917 RepID=A0ABS7CCP5_9BACL|nr:hypothetical protein [Paenibacillus sepulcri]